MRNRTLLAGLLLCTVGSSAGAQTPAQPDPQAEITAPESDNSKPEFSRRSLPADTFKPSEQISEDFPVPFPVDI